jgi:hypothetical protein
LVEHLVRSAAQRPVVKRAGRAAGVTCVGSGGVCVGGGGGWAVMRALLCNPPRVAAVTHGGTGGTHIKLPAHPGNTLHQQLWSSREVQ